MSALPGSAGDSLIVADSPYNGCETVRIGNVEFGDDVTWRRIRQNNVVDESQIGVPSISE